MVTKQQQLEWLASKITKWPDDMGVISVSVDNLGNPGFRAHWDRDWIDFTFEEWQQERDKMAYANKATMIGTQRVPQAIIEAYKALGDLPHASAILEAWEKGAEEFMSELSSKPAQDNSWHESGEFPPAGCECEVLHRGKWIKTVIIGMSPYKSCVYSLIGSESDYAYDGIANSRFFRPLRTEREKAIDEMVSVILDYDGYMITIATAELVARQLHDSGYRNVNNK